MHEYVKEDLRKQISRVVDELVPKLAEDLEIQPINQVLIDTLRAKKAIFDELDKVDSMVADLHMKEFEVTIDFEELLSLRAILADIWINHIIAVRLNCVDEDVLRELIKTTDRLLTIK